MVPHQLVSGISLHFASSRKRKALAKVSIHMTLSRHSLGVQGLAPAYEQGSNMGQDSLQLRLKKEFEAFKSILLESTDTLSLRDVRKMLANRLHAPQEEVDAEKKFVKQLVDVALSEQGNSVRKVSALPVLLAPCRWIHAKLKSEGQ